MPQISQIAEIYASQLFWLLLVFGLIYFGIGRAMLPKIEATVQARDSKIAGDLAAAERARAAADQAEASYGERMEAVRAEAARAIQSARAKAAAETETRVKAADARFAEQAKAVAAQLDRQRDEALGGIEAVAAEAAQEIVSRLSGITPDDEAARAAVRTALAAR